MNTAIIETTLKTRLQLNIFQVVLLQGTPNNVPSTRPASPVISRGHVSRSGGVFEPPASQKLRAEESPSNQTSAWKRVFWLISVKKLTNFTSWPDFTATKFACRYAISTTTKININAKRIARAFMATVSCGFGIAERWGATSSVVGEATTRTNSLWRPKLTDWWRVVMQLWWLFSLVWWWWWLAN